jgi:hypothetical protein
MSDVRERERETNLRALAKRMEFTVEKTGDRFTLTRTVDVPMLEREEGLTLDQAEALLETWKLRGDGS